MVFVAALSVYRQGQVELLLGRRHSLISVCSFLSSVVLAGNAQVRLDLILRLRFEIAQTTLPLRVILLSPQKKKSR